MTHAGKWRVASAMNCSSIFSSNIINCTACQLPRDLFCPECTGQASRNDQAGDHPENDTDMKPKQATALWLASALPWIVTTRPD